MPPINFGSSPVSALRLGAQIVNAVYFGPALVYSANTSPVAPTNITLSAASVSESAAVGTVVGTLSSNGYPAATYSKILDASSKFSVVGNELRIAAALDYETATSHSVTIRAVNSAGSYDKIFAVSVTNDVELPVNTAAPSVNGDATQGGTLTGSDGTWTSAAGAISYIRQWLRDGASISGATGGTYTLDVADVGAMIGYRVTATNADGSTQTTSAAVGPVVASAVSVKLIDFAEGAFSAVRTTNRGYLTSANTIAVVGSNVPRYEDRGDGNGPALLIEGSAVNQWSSPEAATGAINGCVITPDTIIAPDGALTADSAAFTANVNSAFGGTVLSNGAVPDNAKVTIGGWVYSASGGLVRIWSNDKSNVDKSTANIPVGPGWTLISTTFSVGSGASNFTMRIRNATDAAARTVSGWGMNFTATAFPISYIKGNQGAIANPDVMTFLAAQIPLQLRSGFSRWNVYPYYANTDLASGDKYTIMSIGGASDVLQIRHDGTNVIVEAVAGGVVKAASAALTFARHGKLDISVSADTGSISVNGSPGPAGTAWTWPAGVQMRIGGVLAANTEFWGRISEPESL